MQYTVTHSGYTGTIDYNDWTMMNWIMLIIECGLLHASDNKSYFEAYAKIMRETRRRIRGCSVTRTSDNTVFTDTVELFDSAEGLMILKEFTDSLIRLGKFKQLYQSIVATRTP